MVKEVIHILIVDDTRVITKLLEDQISSLVKDQAYDVLITISSSGEDALRKIETSDKAVDIIISDLEMPGLNGFELLKRIREQRPEIMRILLSGYADLEKLAHTLNECEISFFIQKPWKIPHLKILIENACGKILMIRENERLKDSLKQSFFELLNLVMDIIAETAPELYEHGRRTASLSTQMADILNLEQPQKQNIEIASMLHDIGLISLPKTLYKKPRAELTAAERELYAKYPEISSHMLKSTTQLDEVREIIKLHQENYDGSGPHGKKGDEIPLESRILKICDYYDAEINLRNLNRRNVIIVMNRRVNEWFCPVCMRAFVKVITSKEGSVIIPVKLSQLKTGMIIGQNLYSQSGRLILTKGTSITTLNLKRLLIYNELDPIKEVFITVNK